MSFVGRTLIAAPHGRLEAIYRPRDGVVERIALLLHPHPRFGGSMHNKVIYHSARALEELGWETLRFNFRGVGASTGGFDGGVGELDDARTALAFLREQRSDARHTLILGFSFGAGIALALAAGTPGIDALVAIGTPDYAVAQLAAVPSTLPVVFIHGELDAIAPLAAVRDGLRGAPGETRSLVVVAGADHFFAARLDALRAAVRDAARPFT